MAQEIQGNSRKRIEWVDIAKAVTIILMILGHDVERGSSTRGGCKFFCVFGIKKTF